MSDGPIKAGDLVTVDLGNYSNSANTYKVVTKIRGKKYVLAHPLAPECYIIKSADELNQVGASLKNTTEKCLEFCQKSKDYLGFKKQATLDALRFYYVIKKDLAANQKDELSIMCGFLATIYLKNDITIASKLVIDNEGLLDDYNTIWYRKLRPCFSDISKIDTQFKKLFIFKIAGFVMAQLGEKNV